MLNGKRWNAARVSHAPAHTIRSRNNRFAMTEPSLRVQHGNWGHIYRLIITMSFACFKLSATMIPLTWYSRSWFVGVNNNSWHLPFIARKQHNYLISIMIDIFTFSLTTCRVDLNYPMLKILGRQVCTGVVGKHYTLRNDSSIHHLSSSPIDLGTDATLDMGVTLDKWGIPSAFLEPHGEPVTGTPSISLISNFIVQWNRWRSCYLFNKMDRVPVTSSPCGSRTVLECTLEKYHILYLYWPLGITLLRLWHSGSS